MQIECRDAVGGEVAAQSNLEALRAQSDAQSKGAEEYAELACLLAASLRGQTSTAETKRAGLLEVAEGLRMVATEIVLTGTRAEMEPLAVADQVAEGP